MELPKRIDPCPIVDALIEIRFNSNIPPNAVFGFFYGVLKDEFGKPESLPILQLPEAVRNSDPNLKFKPHNKLSNAEYVVQVGPNVIAISSFPNYLGWEAFSKKIFDILMHVNDLGIVKDILRLGIRYINFFEYNIFDKIDLNVSLNDKNISYRNTVIRTEIEDSDFINTLNIANNAKINNKNGSIIDIDTWCDNNLSNFFDDKEELIGNGHLIEKKLFFSLLKKDFLMQLNPEY